MIRNKLRLALSYSILVAIAMTPLIIRADQADVLYKEGLELEEEGKRDFAVFKYFTITRNYPRSKWADEALFKIAEFYYEHRDYFNAKDSFERLITQYPQSSFVTESKKYLENISAMSKKSGAGNDIKNIISNIENLRNEQRWDDIIAECDKLSALEPLPAEYKRKMVEYYKLCGDAYITNEELGKAKVTYEKIIKIVPDDIEVLNKLYEINKLLTTPAE
ncbi:MAG: tetratricopeptide repeat protein [Candidatus Omnitrophica bacterium]|nr:tetratricopeptide repeat protein [Candidatus Omnitrophota bacterium]